MNRSWTGVALVISVIINVFLIGTAVGVLALGARLAHEHRPPGPGGGGQLWRASMALPPAQARAFRQAVRAQAEAGRPMAEAGRRARQAAWLTGAAEPFDAAATKAALARARSLDQATRARLEEALVDIAGALPPAERRVVFQALADPARGRQAHMRMMHGGPPPPPGPPGPEGPEGPPPAP
jgi:uncharacterized membrane protein